MIEPLSPPQLDLLPTADVCWEGQTGQSDFELQNGVQSSRGQQLEAPVLLGVLGLEMISYFSLLMTHCLQDNDGQNLSEAVSASRIGPPSTSTSIV